MIARHEASCSGETGAALLSALLIVSLMAVAAIALLETVRFSVRTSINLSDREQARLYAIGAETLATASIRQMRKSGEDRFPALDEWTRQPVTFPIRDGRVRVHVRDGANCLNLNALVEADPAGALRTQPETRARFSGLLQALGLAEGEAEALAASLADWIDSDARPGFGGAEDDFYTALETPYRTPGEFMVDMSELRLVRGYTAELANALEPVACVQGHDELAPLNINTLRPGQAPLLQAYLGENFDLFEAEQIIAERPRGGYATLEQFFSEPVFRGRVPTEEAQALFALSSQSYIATIEVDYRASRVEMTSRLVILEDGRVRSEARRYGS
ncbi:MAG: type II secretion system minor pseudopilin GspK [Alphaproteobacteria bacterium]|jgi:general secretion pathway protein K|nr:type II secretion system minor pseudopilin GspK [Alphaproteobacteria bacterium]